MSCDDTANCLETPNDVQHFLRGVVGGRRGPRTASVFVSGESGSGKTHHVLAAVDWVVGALRAHQERPLAHPPHHGSSLVDACVLIQPTSTDVFLSFQKTTGRSRLTTIVQSAIDDATTSYYTAASVNAAPRQLEVDAAVGTLVVLLDRFDVFLGSDAGGSRGDTDNDDVAGAPDDDLHLVMPQFAAEFYTIVHPTPSRDASDDDHLGMRWRRVFIVTTTTGNARTTPVVHAALAPRLFQWHLHVHPPAYATRRAYFEDRLGRGVEDAAAQSNDQQQIRSLLGTAADGLAGRTGGLVYGGMDEVLEAFSLELARCYKNYETSATQQTLATLNERGSVEASEASTHRSFLQCLSCSMSLLCDAAMRTFFASDSQQAVAAKKRVGYVDVVETRWSDIAGLQPAKDQLRRLVMEPVKRKAVYNRLVGCGVRPSIGVVLHGPPGTGKTMLAKAMATELKASFVYLDLPQLIHSEVGSSEATLRQFFDVAKRRSPCVMFLDEVQAAFGSRSTAHGNGDDDVFPGGGHSDDPQHYGGPAASSHDARLVSCFLSLLDEAQESVDYDILFVCATNAFHLLDPLLLRAGRLDTHIHIGNPDDLARAALVNGIVEGRWAQWWASSDDAVQRNRRHCARDALKRAFTTAAEGMSGAEICNALNVFALSLLSGGGDGGSGGEAALLAPLPHADGIAAFMMGLLVAPGGTVDDATIERKDGDGRLGPVRWSDRCRLAFSTAFPLRASYPFGM